jgi:NTE family protein
MDDPGPRIDVTGPSSAKPARRPIFAIFEGGGAKGVAHVGALDAVGANNLEIIGVAGTSAGALAAVLAAIGLDASDIMDERDSEANILTQNGTDPVLLLGGEHAWARFCYVRDTAAGLFQRRWALKNLLGLLDVPYVLPILFRAWRRRGHFTTKRIQSLVNDVIRDRLLEIKAEAQLGLEVPREPTFGDLTEDWPTVVPLKIVVTDVSRGRLEVLDRFTTPNVKVAEAVAASIAIPFAFEPALIPSFRPGLFADGGLVSNLPIWVYVEEKLARERERDGGQPIPIIGFSLQPTAPQANESTGLPSMFDYSRALVETALAGSQGTSNRFMEDLTIISLETEIPMLAFDADWESLRKARETGRVCADRALKFLLDVKPDRIRSELRGIHDSALKLINERRRLQRKRRVDQLRVNLIRPWGNFSLRVIEGVNMTSDADDRLLLDLRGQGSALAFKEKGVRVLRVSSEANCPSRVFMTKYERALVRSTVRSMVCVPIFGDSREWSRDEPDREKPGGVLCLDCDDSEATADFNDPQLKNLLVDKSSVLFAAISLEVGSG